ncbi:hypothetical protein P4U43_05210 [Arthrobacter sp. EH-1B-1]|uniref:DUF559 domain-containing protein n=1 Tax=Arthrobacter vasquezii TaxID=2977629 RepID=A0ABT6CTH2_9MICC|nr:hypothetical protein [Arthrobacter vasquezii]MDF9277190.1 hypothetical protein [Arthrobacter vasquezii]
MPKRAPLPDELVGRSFTLRSALSADLSISRTRAKDLTTPSREVRVPVGAIQPVLSRCRPYVELLPGSFVSHTTAAEIHGIHLPHWISHEQVHLSRGRQTAGPRRKGVKGHRLDISEGDVVEIDGLPVTSLARTWLDLATVLPLEDLVVAGDQIISEHTRSFGPPRIPMVPKRDLERFIATHGRSWGIQKARSAFDRLRVGVDSPPESLVRLILEDAGLPEFSVNCPLRDANGVIVAWTDLGCEAFRVCIEYDGEHHLTPEQQAKDMARDAKVAEVEWAQVKLNSLDLPEGSWRVVAKVKKALLRQGWRPGSQELLGTSSEFPNRRPA